MGLKWIWNGIEMDMKWDWMGANEVKSISFFLFSLFCTKRFNNIKNWKKQTNKLFKMTCYNMNSSEWWERKENKKEESILYEKE